MPDSIVYRPHSESPARARFADTGRSQRAAGEVRSFEFVSRGDFVSGALILPETKDGRPAPLVLITFADGRSESLAGASFATDWVQRGFALVAIDLPLQGRRSSPKLSERLTEGIDHLTHGGELDLDTRALVEEFARQSTSDLLRTAEAMGVLPEIDADRIGVLGIGLGAITSAYALAHHDSFRAGVLALGAAEIADPSLDPANQFRDLRVTTQCAILVEELGATASGADASLARSLFEAVPDPKQWAAFGATSDRAHPLPEEAEGVAHDFLSKHLHL